MFKKTIISEFFTTVSLNQALNSLYLMTFGIFKLKNGKEKQIFEEKLLNYLGKKDKKIISFYNGRSAIYHTLKMIGVKSDDEVIVNAYNCVSVSNAVIQSGAKIVYSDIEDETLSFDFEILKKNISEKTKIVIIQHTFGKQAHDYKKIIDFCKKENILVIEDCAHSLGNKTEILGDFAIFSTGRDKVISSVTGGFLVINKKEFIEKDAINGHLYSSLKIPSIGLILQNLNYNIVGYKAYKLYDFFKLGRVIIFLSRKLKLITEILTPNEKACNFDNFYLDFPNSLAYLARKELKKLDEYTEERIEKSIDYIQLINNSKIKVLFKVITENDYNGFRFPIILKSEEEKNKLIKFARKNNIILGTSWSGINIAPIGSNLEKSNYKLGSCPIAEDISKRILTLPNHKMITKKDMDRAIEVLNNFE